MREHEFKIIVFENGPDAEPRESRVSIDLDEICAYNDEFDGLTRVDLNNGRYWVVKMEYDAFKKLKNKKRNYLKDVVVIMSRADAEGSPITGEGSIPDPNHIPFLEGRPDRDDDISKDNIVDLRITLNEIRTVEVLVNRKDI